MALPAGGTRAVDTHRVVSVGGALTEIVYALGAADRLIAVDSTSIWPPEADALPDVGYMRRLSAEPILALAPSLVIAIEGAGPAAALDQIRGAGVDVALVPDQPTPEGVLAKIERVATLLGFEAKGSALARDVEAALAQARAQVAEVKERARVLFVMSIGGGAPIAAGTDTAADAIIRLAGGVNAIEDYEGYKPLTPEAAVLSAPDILLTTYDTLTRAGGAEGLLRTPALAATEAARRNRLVGMEGMLLLGFGPRTPMAIEQLATALRPSSQRDG